MNPKVSSTTSTTSVAKPKEHFYFLDALRGIAALWVILFHAPLDGHKVAIATISRSYFLQSVSDPYSHLWSSIFRGY